jgi:hypothetical protein
MKLSILPKIAIIIGLIGIFLFLFNQQVIGKFLMAMTFVCFIVDGLMRQSKTQ